MTTPLRSALLLSLPLLCLTARAQDGALDGSFGNGGTVHTDLGGGTEDKSYALAVQPDGAIVLAGTSGFGEPDDIGVLRYLNDGTPDPAFGSGGHAVVSISPGMDYAKAVAIQADSAILVGGYTYSDQGILFALMRLTWDGQPDASFGTNGMVVTDLGSGATSIGTSLALQSDGRILFAGGGIAGASVVRYDPDGTVDETFGTLGLVTCPFSSGFAQANAIVLTPNDGFAIVGYTNDNDADSIAVAWYNADGTPQSGMGDNGTMTVGTSAGAVGTSASLDPEGRLVIGGYTPTQALIARLDAQGQLDPSFYGAGYRQLNVPGATASRGYAVAAMPDDRILLAGQAHLATNDFLLVRVNEDGTYDLGFDGDGFVTTDVTGDDDVATAMHLDLGGTVLLGGYAQTGAFDYNFAAARYFTTFSTGIASVAGRSGALVAPDPLSDASMALPPAGLGTISAAYLADMRGAVVWRGLGPWSEGSPVPLAGTSHLPAGAYVLGLIGAHGIVHTHVVR